MKRSLLMLPALIAAAPLPQPVKPLPAKLGAIRAYLFYESTATLSGNIAPPADFDGWNTIIGEGPAKDSARDVLVTVPLSLPTGADMSADSIAPVILSAKGQDGKVLATRTIDNILVPYRGQVYEALWLRDATCAGLVTVRASYGTQVKTATLKLGCGE